MSRGGVAGFVSLIGPLGEVTVFTWRYRVYLVHVELMQLFFILSRFKRWQKLTTTTKLSQATYAKLLHYLWIKKDQSPFLSSLTTTICVIVVIIAGVCLTCIYLFRIIIMDGDLINLVPMLNIQNIYLECFYVQRFIGLSHKS